MDTVGDMADRHFLFRPARKEGLENISAHLFMQLADAIDGSAAADGRILQLLTIKETLRVKKQ